MCDDVCGFALRRLLFNLLIFCCYWFLWWWLVLYVDGVWLWLVDLSCLDLVWFVCRLYLLVCYSVRVDYYYVVVSCLVWWTCCWVVLLDWILFVVVLIVVMFYFCGFGFVVFECSFRVLFGWVGCCMDLLGDTARTLLACWVIVVVFFFVYLCLVVCCYLLIGVLVVIWFVWCLCWCLGLYAVVCGCGLYAYLL